MTLFESARQAPLFAVFICCGAFLGSVYDFLYIFRRNRKPLLLAISDILFSIVFLVSSGVCTFFFNSGKLEWFFFVGIFLGFLTERITLGKLLKISIDFLAKILYNLSIKFDLNGKVKSLFK